MLGKKSTFDFSFIMKLKSNFLSNFFPATRLQRQVSADGTTTLVQYTTDTSTGQTHLTQQLQVATPAQEANANLVSGLTSPRSNNSSQFTTPASGGAIKIAPRGVSPSSTGLIPRGVVSMRPPAAPSPSPFSPPPRQPMPDEMNRQLRDLLQRQQVKREYSL